MPDPTFTAPPTAPSRSQAREVFVANMNAFLAWFATLYAELVILVTWVGGKVTEITELIEDANVAFDQKLAGAGFTGESVTSNSIGVGSKTWTLEAGLDFVPGAFFSAADRAAPNTNYMTGQVTSYNFATGVLVGTMDRAFGSGTKTDWVFSVIGRPGNAATIADVGGLQDALDAKAALLDTINSQTGTTYTLVSGDLGKVVEITNASAITLTLPNSLPVGWNCIVRQGGAGAITRSLAGGATLRNRNSHTKTAGQWAEISLSVRSNSGGSAAEYVMSGDTAA